MYPELVATDVGQPLDVHRAHASDRAVAVANHAHDLAEAPPSRGEVEGAVRLPEGEHRLLPLVSVPRTTSTRWSLIEPLLAGSSAVGHGLHPPSPFDCRCMTGAGVPGSGQARRPRPSHWPVSRLTTMKSLPSWTCWKAMPEARHPAHRCTMSLPPMRRRGARPPEPPVAPLVRSRPGHQPDPLVGAAPRRDAVRRRRRRPSRRDRRRRRRRRGRGRARATSRPRARRARRRTGGARRRRRRSSHRGRRRSATMPRARSRSPKRARASNGAPPNPCTRPKASTTQPPGPSSSRAMPRTRSASGDVNDGDTGGAPPNSNSEPWASTTQPPGTLVVGDEPAGEVGARPPPVPWTAGAPPNGCSPP